MARSAALATPKAKTGWAGDGFTKTRKVAPATTAARAKLAEIDRLPVAEHMAVVGSDDGQRLIEAAGGQETTEALAD